MKLKVLGSSSKGNSYILESPTQTLLIECGISYKDILKGLNFNLGEVVGCILTHAHQDHSKSAKDLVSAGIDLYALEDTVNAIGLASHRIVEVEPLKQFKVGDFNILGFPIEHDVPGLGYLIQYVPTGEKLLFLTDSYYSKYKFKNLNYILIECNYIKETLDQNIEDGYINEASKPRLLQSHFSLENVKEFLNANNLSDCQEIILLHLSNRNANSDQMFREIYIETGIMPKIATKGLEVKLEKEPY